MRNIAGCLLALALVGQAQASELAATAQAAISHYRAEHGLGPVRPDSRLMQLAAEQARAMARAGVMEHDVARPFSARIVSYDPSIAVENIATGTTTFASTLALWERSPGHDANLRRAGVTHFGIASASGASGHRTFWALIMAAPDRDHGLRQAGMPGLLRAAPGQGPVVRVRAKPSPESEPGMLSRLKAWLSPISDRASAKPQ